MLTSPFNSGFGLDYKGDDGAETSMCAGAIEVAKSDNYYSIIDKHRDGSIMLYS